VLLTDGKWHYNEIADIFSGNTGADVVIGIIDTGIDFNHPCFQSTNGTETRIHAIWDQYLTPRTGESSPAANLLVPGTTTRYGVEYEKAAIDTTPDHVRHVDEDGHGTHVAGIAAGNGAANTGTNSSKTANIGIAPEARIIVVNFMHDGTSNIGNDIQQRDAFHYILNKAEALFGAATPVVINCSFGGELHPHDGRGWEGNEYLERHLHGIFNGVAGKICVAAAGNAAGENGHLQLVMPAAPNNQTDLPFTIIDSRVRPKKTVNLQIEMVYPASVNNVKGWIKLPGLASFFGGNAPGAISGTDVDNFYDGTFGTARHRVTMSHYTQFARSPYGNVARRNLSLTLIPRTRRQNTGNYVLRIEAPAGATLQLWIDVSDPDYRIVFDRAALVLTPGVSIVNKSTLGSPGQSPDVITVAAYDVNTGGTPFITDFSSRGPLVSYDAQPVVADKPDVAAPGRNINSANIGALARAVSPTGHYVSHSGTSTAAPHITGLIALMLQKDGTLTRQDIIDAFRDSTSTPFAILDLSHDPAPDFDNTTYTVPALNPPQAGTDEGGHGRLNYSIVIDQI
jgi:subtilisin family serine protease